jgi:hypothetical protein
MPRLFFCQLVFVNTKRHLDKILPALHFPLQSLARLPQTARRCPAELPADKHKAEA